jgi:hypothetical protein
MPFGEEDNIIDLKIEGWGENFNGGHGPSRGNKGT